ncbi:hypothetical protein H0H87_001394 [Tephrocybe sp. NHM501043]|nr:hypothetical protein H0H87_001394 [Tephrocybe sp. NHM501043]
MADTIATGWTQSTIGGGVRSSSATSYLGPNFLTRENLHVLVNSQVSRILKMDDIDGQPAFKAIEIRKDVDGIGDSSTLSSLGITPLVDLVSVGCNLSGTTKVAEQWLVNSTDTFDELNCNSSLAEDAFRQWNESRTGPLVVSTFNHIGFLRLPSNSSIFTQYQDPSAGPHTPHLELMPTNGIVRPPFPVSGNFMVMGISLLSPLYGELNDICFRFLQLDVLTTPIPGGSVTLKSNNPFDPPVIDLNILSSEFDIFALREGIRNARWFISAPVWGNCIISLISNATTDAKLDECMRKTAGPGLHTVGCTSLEPVSVEHENLAQ